MNWSATGFAVPYSKPPAEKAADPAMHIGSTNHKQTSRRSRTRSLCSANCHYARSSAWRTLSCRLELLDFVFVPADRGAAFGQPNSAGKLAGLLEPPDGRIGQARASLDRLLSENISRHCI